MQQSNQGRAVLVLEDGTRFDGRSLGAQTEQVGEVCFNTSMTGYQEIMSDPSYAGQIVTMTYTQIGNVGINPEDMESRRPWIRGFIVKESARRFSSWRAQESLSVFLTRHNIPAIEGIDTRALVSHLRDKGAMRGVLSTLDFNTENLIAKAKSFPGLAGMDLTGEVSCQTPYPWQQGLWDLEQGYRQIESGSNRKRVTVMDFGVKHNILRGLVQAGCDLTVVPTDTPAEKILAGNPDGIFLSNGPGDPDAVKHGVRTIRALLETKIPIFGICLGHQMLCLALGAQTLKMKFGHRGGNHPVQNLSTGVVEVTSQNHGFVVSDSALPDTLEVTHRSLFDGSVEGVRMKDKPVFSVQYHPEASPGPHDAHYLFKQFADLMR
ncbi:carbamoyl-phosphate synthase small subunit [Magnetococcus marinus MC-1]|uniref:Carbamoyl phosphate synthase small chain n=1 Tax=Magnetococcus marinus (strain ATCC BAA-1437 / JCM 17883 / MC-1) TaxID=156889 RepID=A0LC17_MAGMM|nr:glutamine-hydrolyzing carbamoyl-phosphate synthase small subunit [Magnetococcus marinus]ABK45510.1 carbamoyl-phosphate synthase small subunit [Magnetococcus marinus MC-1]